MPGSVHWLELTLALRQKLPSSAKPPGTVAERVALDDQTYKPMFVRALVDGRVQHEYRVIEIGTIEATDLFRRPRLVVAPLSGSVVDAVDVQPADVALREGGSSGWEPPTGISR